MYRTGQRRCPACRGPMREIVCQPARGEPTRVDLCDPCGSLFVEFLDGEPSAIARALVRELDVPRHPRALPGDRRCPECERRMEPVGYLGDGPVLDRCGTCLAFFATIETLQRLAQYRMSRPPPTGTEPSAPSWIERLVARLTSRG